MLNDRFIAIDNVCAWPNLTVLNDGTIIASIFNKPSHGRGDVDVECWAIQNGHFWEKRGVPSRHTPNTNRMNVAVGLAKNGDLIILENPPSLMVVMYLLALLKKACVNIRS